MEITTDLGKELVMNNGNKKKGKESSKRVVILLTIAGLLAAFVA